MLTRSPIGKRHARDDANYWTIVVDAANFAGPVMYMAAWFWDSRINWHPESTSWSDPRALLGYIATGFEGSIGAAMWTDADGFTWYKTNEWAFPVDENAKGDQKTSTLFTGHSQYNSDWLNTVLDPILDGTSPATPALAQAVAKASLAGRTLPDECGRPNEWTPLKLETDDADIVSSLGVGDDAFADPDQAQADFAASGCDMRLTLSSGALDCTSKPGWCIGNKFLREGGSTGGHCSDPSVKDSDDNDDRAGCVDGCWCEFKACGDVFKTEETCTGWEEGYGTIEWKERSWKTGSRLQQVLAKDVPSATKSKLDQVMAERFKPTKKNTGRFLGPPADKERPCFDTPGPSDDKLYCVRTTDRRWLGFKWYKFIEQPELNQVFAAIPAAERDAAKCYMQRRVERLHAMQNTGTKSSPARWFRPPAGEAKLPKALVSIDESLLVAPPSGLEVGYVSEHTPVPPVALARWRPKNVWATHAHDLCTAALPRGA